MQTFLLNDPAPHKKFDSSSLFSLSVNFLMTLLTTFHIPENQKIPRSPRW